MSTPRSPASDAGGDRLIVNRSLSIPRAELTFRASRSGGPGGQHVNTSSTRVELLWNVAASGTLDESQRTRLTEKLGRRLDGSGTLRVVASDHRSQLRNRESAELRLAAMVAEALLVPKRRKATRPTRAAKQARLDQKKRRSSIKKDRRTNRDD